MTARPIVQSVEVIFKGFWKRHVRVLGAMVAGAFSARKLQLSAVGRQMPGRTSPKHAIKRVDRFLSNPRFDHRRAQEALLRRVIGPRKRVLIAVDWTKVRRWQVLVAAVVQSGRCIPVMWAVQDPKKVHKSWNAFEHGFFSWLAEALPEGVEAVLLLDRGFKRVELVRVLRRLGLRFVIRTGGNVHVRHARYCGRIDELVRRRRQPYDLPDAMLRPSRPVPVRVVGYWDRGQKEPWLLMTDLDEPVRRIVQLYGKRFRIEECFRDTKNVRYGLALAQAQFRRAERLERFLLVAALVHLLAMTAGAVARQKRLDRTYRANTVQSRPTHSDFTLGLYFALRMRRNLARCLRILYEDPEGSFWG